MLCKTLGRGRVCNTGGLGLVVEVMGIVTLETPDEQLATRAKAGDVPAFELLVHRHTPGLCAFCARLLGDRTEAEDRVQEAFLRAYQNLYRFNPAYRFSSWLYKIAQNLCVDALRGKHAWGQLPEQDPSASEPEPVGYDEVDRLESAVTELPARTRAVLHYKYVLGLNATEIGRELDMTPQNVRVHLHRAIRTLRTRLAP